MIGGVSLERKFRTIDWYNFPIASAKSSVGLENVPAFRRVLDNFTVQSGLTNVDPPVISYRDTGKGQTKK